MTHTRFFVLACVAIALLCVPIATVAADDTEQRGQTIDEYAAIEDWTYEDGAYHVELNGSEGTTVYALPPLDSDGEASSNVNPTSATLDGSSTTTMVIEGDGDVQLVTENFFDTVGVATLSSGTGALVPNPTAVHLWIVGGATAVGMASMTIGRVVAAMLGVGQTTERVA
ncbi:hypothetical protein [Natrarchaeobaculum aegyptiacum]|uniref:Uncharacterized protein n=1 Tax=Natrarchaeobaculum aegyptiacum TaxID=745377 RepID=A0A2Z2HU39_9EURY|nr:hypothetical protein [Natrarchaeobaculum aegyptiacum]ARS89645.1 hypothetical protein B1756_07775 [Natrarchaeobaculum aegyptiacum]